MQNGGPREGGRGGGEGEEKVGCGGWEKGWCLGGVLGQESWHQSLGRFQRQDSEFPADLAGQGSPGAVQGSPQTNGLQSVLPWATRTALAGQSLFLKCNFIIYFWLFWIFIAVRGLSLVMVHRLLNAHRLLDAVASPVAEHAWALGHAGSVVHGLSCLVSCGVFWDQGLNPCPLHWQADS